jgi:hypothetical protein
MWVNWQRKEIIVSLKKSLCIVTNQNNYLILLISFFEVKRLLPVDPYVMNGELSEHDQMWITDDVVFDD